MNLARSTWFLALVGILFTPIAGAAQDGWLLFRGNAQRTGAASSLPAWAKRPAWQRPLLMDKLQGFDEADRDEAAKALIEKLRKNADPTILPAFYPIVVDEACIYQTHVGVRGVAMQEMREKDIATGVEQVTRPSEILWKCIPMNASLSFLAEKRRILPALTELLAQKKQEHWLWANPLIGSISSDGKDVFSINDFAFPAVEITKPFVGRVLGDLKPLYMGNGLSALDAITGKIHWDTCRVVPPFEEKAFCLGAPLPVGKKIYVLNEKAGDLRLLSFDPVPKLVEFQHVLNLEKSLTLLKVPAAEQVPAHAMRRTQPLHIAYADDLLVCPTHAGVLVGVDRAKMEVRWQYRYRAENAAAPELPHWQAACPIIFKNRIVYTAADAPEIHCIGLDGKKQWIAPADKDLYLATVHGDIVLLVGKTHCRALDLADGREKWRLGLGLPAGVGVKDGSLYYVPIKRDAKTDGPTIWAIDLAKGKQVRRVAVPYPDALGNLVLHRGMFVSQSVTHIASFPLIQKMP